jgi:hypothetical protein
MRPCELIGGAIYSTQNHVKGSTTSWESPASPHHTPGLLNPGSLPFGVYVCSDLRVCRVNGKRLAYATSRRPSVRGMDIEGCKLLYGSRQPSSCFLDVTTQPSLDCPETHTC